MTRNTKFYKTSAEVDGVKTDIYYKDLSTIELYAISNIKNHVVKCEFAAAVAIENIPLDKISFPTKIQIGEDVLYRSAKELTDPALLDVTISEFRERIVEGDPILTWISHITKYLPGTSIVDLLKLTTKDIIELVVLCEEMSGQQIFGSGKKKGMNLVDPKTLSKDDRKALTDQIRDLNNSIGIPR